MQRHGHHVGDHDKNEPVPSSRNRAIDDPVPVPCPEENLTPEFEVEVPPRRALFGCLTQKQIFPGQTVEVETAQHQDRVVQPVLHGDGDFGHSVEFHDAVVVSRSQALEKAWGDGEERHVFDVRVVLGRVGDDVVHVVVPLPPADRQAADVVGYEDRNAAVDVENVGDADVRRVVRGEDQLMPQHADQGTGEGVIGISEGDHGAGEKQHVAT